MKKKALKPAYMSFLEPKILANPNLTSEEKNLARNIIYDSPTGGNWVGMVSSEDKDEDGIVDTMHLEMSTWESQYKNDERLNQMLETLKTQPMKLSEDEVDYFVDELSRVVKHEQGHLTGEPLDEKGFKDEAAAHSREHQYIPISPLSANANIYNKNKEFEMKKGLISLANRLDSIGHSDLADRIDSILKKADTTGIDPETGLVTTWTSSTPTTKREFNAYLASLLDGLNIPQDIIDLSSVSFEVRRDPELLLEELGESIPDDWVRATGAAFREFAKLAGKPDAAKGGNWEAWASENGYKSTLGGIYQFWADNIKAVSTKLIQSQDTFMSADKKLEDFTLPEVDQTAMDLEEGNISKEDAFAKLDKDHAKRMEELFALEAESSPERAEKRQFVERFKASSPSEQRRIVREQFSTLTDAIAEIEGLDAQFDMAQIAQTIDGHMKSNKMLAGIQNLRDRTTQVGRMGREEQTDESYDNLLETRAKMNYKKIAKGLVELSNHLDTIGRSDFADNIDNIIKNNRSLISGASNQEMIEKMNKTASLKDASSEEKVNGISKSLENIFSPIGSYKHVRR